MLKSCSSSVFRLQKNCRMHEFFPSILSFFHLEFFFKMSKLEAWHARYLAKKWHEFLTAKGFVENVCKIYELINNLLHSEENLKLLDFHRWAWNPLTNRPSSWTFTIWAWKCTPLTQSSWAFHSWRAVIGWEVYIFMPKSYTFRDFDGTGNNFLSLQKVYNRLVTYCSIHSHRHNKHA